MSISYLQEIGTRNFPDCVKTKRQQHFRSDTKMVSKLKGHCLLSHHDRSPITTSEQRGMMRKYLIKMGSGYIQHFKCLLAYLPRHGSTESYYRHQSEGCNFHFPPLLEERVKRSERNHVRNECTSNKSNLGLTFIFSNLLEEGRSRQAAPALQLPVPTVPKSGLKVWQA